MCLGVFGHERAVSEKKMSGTYNPSSRIINVYLTVECVLRTCSPLLDGYSLWFRLRTYSSGCDGGDGGPRQKITKCNMDGGRGGQKYRFLNDVRFD